MSEALAIPDAPAARDESLIACIEAVLEGDLTVRPEGDDPLSAAIGQLIEKITHDATSSLDHAVSLLMDANESAIAAGQLLRAAREVENRTQTIAAAIEEMVTSVQSISESSQDASRSAQSVEQAAAEGMKAVTTAVDTMENINRAVDEAAAKVDDLASASEHIGEIVTSIEKIASQTNLLALNATIEAARAGEAGKGFAVVASEVKNLSRQTADATLDIRQRIERLQNEMTQIISSMGEGAEATASGREVMGSVGEGMSAITERVDDVNARMSDIADILAQQSDASQEVAESVSKIADMSRVTVEQIETTADSMDNSLTVIENLLADLSNYEMPGKILRLAKADHVAWKKRLSDMLVGRTHLDPDELADHTSCRLGKWYYSDRAAAFRDHPAFKALESAHEAVHAHGIEATRRYNANDLDGALAEILKVEEASAEVLKHLDALKEAVDAA